MASEVPLFSVANIITSSFNNPPVNIPNDSSSVYYGSFNFHVPITFRFLSLSHVPTAFRSLPLSHVPTTFTDPLHS